MRVETVRLSELCDLIAEPVRPGARPDALYLGLEHLAPGRLVRIGSGQASDMRSTTSAFQPGDVLYGKLRPYLDKAVLADEAGVCTTELLVLRAKAGVDPRFLAAVVHSPGFLQYAILGTTGVQHPRTSWAHTRDFELPVFAFDEQRQIADLLWLVHEAINYSETLVEEGQVLKRAAMRTLFTRGLRGEPQKQTEIGPVPASWSLVPFARAVLLQRGFDLPVSQRQNGNVPVFGSNGIVGHHNEVPSNIPIPGVLIGRSGSIGRVNFTAGLYWPLNTTLFATDFFGNDARFIGYFLEQFDFSRFAQGVSVPTLNRNSFADFLVAIPSINEQREMVAILDAIDRKIDLHRRKRTVLEDLFKALLHKLMTGEIRADDLDSAAIRSSLDLSSGMA